MGSIVAVLACSSRESAAVDAGTVDASAVDGSTVDGSASTMDAADAWTDRDRRDGGDLGPAEVRCGSPPSRCHAFQVCAARACVCDPRAEALCGRGGFASWPIPTPDERSYRDAGDVVLDEVTGLVWQRQTDTVLRAWEDAHTYCEGLSLAGRDDFRLPSRVELMSLVIPERIPAADPVFGDIVREYHWTASVPGFDPRFAYSVYFGAHEMGWANRSVGGIVRCVASDAPATARVVGAELVEDQGTGLWWERAVSGPMSHAEAVTRCDGLVLGGHDDFRVPTLNEVASIVDESYGGVDPTIYAIGATALWSSSTTADAQTAWVLDPERGSVWPWPTTSSLTVRCVRGD